MDFMKEHIFEALLAIIGALALLIVQTEISRAYGEVARTQCSLARVETQNQIQNVEDELISGSLDDLKVNSPQILTLEYLQRTFGEDLQKCPEGKDLLHMVSALHDGLLSWVSKDLDTASKQFDTLPPQDSLKYTLLGWTKYRQAESAQGDTAAALKQQAARDFQSAQTLVKLGERHEFLKLVLRVECNRLMTQGGREANSRAIECLKKTVDRGYADHTTYYNLSAMTSRIGDFPAALSYMRECITRFGPELPDYMTETDVLNDPDFRDYILKSDQAGPFRSLVVQEFQP